MKCNCLSAICRKPPYSNSSDCEANRIIRCNIDFDTNCLGFKENWATECNNIDRQLTAKDNFINYSSSSVRSRSGSTNTIVIIFIVLIILGLILIGLIGAIWLFNSREKSAKSKQKALTKDSSGQNKQRTFNSSKRSSRQGGGNFKKGINTVSSDNKKKKLLQNTARSGEGVTFGKLTQRDGSCRGSKKVSGVLFQGSKKGKTSSKNNSSSSSNTMGSFNSRAVNTQKLTTTSNKYKSTNKRDMLRLKKALNK